MQSGSSLRILCALDSEGNFHGTDAAFISVPKLLTSQANRNQCTVSFRFALFGPYLPEQLRALTSKL